MSPRPYFYVSRDLQSTESWHTVLKIGPYMFQGVPLVWCNAHTYEFSFHSISKSTTIIILKVICNYFLPWNKLTTIKHAYSLLRCNGVPVFVLLFMSFKKLENEETRTQLLEKQPQMDKTWQMNNRNARA